MTAKSFPNLVKNLNSKSSVNPKQNICEENHAHHSQTNENQKKNKILKLGKKNDILYTENDDSKVSQV